MSVYQLRSRERDEQYLERWPLRLSECYIVEVWNDLKDVEEHSTTAKVFTWHQLYQFPIRLHPMKNWAMQEINIRTDGPRLPLRIHSLVDCEPIDWEERVNHSAESTPMDKTETSTYSVCNRIRRDVPIHEESWVGEGSEWPVDVTVTATSAFRIPRCWTKAYRSHSSVALEWSHNRLTVDDTFHGRLWE